MKKKLLAVFLTVLMLIGVSLTAFAVSPAIQYTSSYNADTGLVSVTLFLSDPVGLKAADLNLAYDPNEYSFVDCQKNSGGEAFVEGGKAVTEDGLCTCSVVFTSPCDAEDLDENGNLVLATYQFKPLTDQYDIDNFCAWATSYDTSGGSMLGSIKSYGNENLKVGHNNEVTVKAVAVKKDTSSSTSPAIQYTSSYNADTGLVSVTLFVSDPVGLEATDLNLAYDPNEYSFVDCTGNDSIFVAAGKAETEDGLCTCSVIFVESCVAEDLDENGNLVLATYQFKPLTDKYDIDNFCAWATSFDTSGGSMLGSIKSYGNENLKVGHNNEVTVKQNSSSSTSSGIGSKWYVYVIAAVLAVCAVVGIAVIAVKNGQKDASGDAENGKKHKKKSDKAGSDPKETDPSDQDEPEE